MFSAQRIVEIDSIISELPFEVYAKQMKLHVEKHLMFMNHVYIVIIGVHLCFAFRVVAHCSLVGVMALGAQF